MYKEGKTMYKCKECGAEYEEKPDYCDCGNDEFELVSVKPEQSKTLQGESIPEKTIDIKPKVQPAAAGRTTFTPPPQKKSFGEQYPGLSRMMTSIDPISLVIFIVCLLLSLYVVFFAWNPTEQEIVSQDKQESVVPKNIPSIDKIWNNTPPVYQKKEEKKETQEEKIVNQILQTVVPQKSAVQKPVQTQKTSQATKPVQTTKPTVTKVQLNKNTQTTKPKTVTAAPKTQTSVKTQTSTTVNSQAQKAAEDAAKKKAEQERLAAEAAQLKNLQAEQAQKAAEKQARQAAAAKQEYANYKVQLRNTIGRKIDFTRVIGDGSCTVAFKIDSTGRLVNRSFAKQSSNNTLNDAVYAAVMATPTFNPPPSAYNNETLNLNIRFTNGNFEISLP